MAPGVAAVRFQEGDRRVLGRKPSRVKFKGVKVEVRQCNNPELVHTILIYKMETSHKLVQETNQSELFVNKLYQLQYL